MKHFLILILLLAVNASFASGSFETHRLEEVKKQRQRRGYSHLRFVKNFNQFKEGNVVSVDVDGVFSNPGDYGKIYDCQITTKDKFKMLGFYLESEAAALKLLKRSDAKKGECAFGDGILNMNVEQVMAFSPKSFNWIDKKMYASTRNQFQYVSSHSGVKVGDTIYLSDHSVIPSRSVVLRDQSNHPHLVRASDSCYEENGKVEGISQDRGTVLLSSIGSREWAHIGTSCLHGTFFTRSFKEVTDDLAREKRLRKRDEEMKKNPWFDLDKVSKSKYISKKKAKKFWTEGNPRVFDNSRESFNNYEGFKVKPYNNQKLVNYKKVAVDINHRKNGSPNARFGCSIDETGTISLIKKSPDKKKHLLYYAKSWRDDPGTAGCLSGFFVAPASYFDSL